MPQLLGADQVDVDWSVVPLIEATETNLEVLLAEPLTKYYLLFLFVGWILTYQILHKVFKIKYHESLELAYDIFSFTALLFMGVFGLLFWVGFYPGDPLSQIDKRDVYAKSPEVLKYIIVPMACYQFWNFTVSLFIPVYQTLVPLAHHFFAFFLAFYCLEPIHCYAITYYFGMCEISTSFCCILCYFKRHPDRKAKYKIFNMFCEFAFGVLFVLLRIVLNVQIFTDFMGANNALIIGEHKSAGLFGPAKSVMVIRMIMICTYGICLVQISYIHTICQEVYGMIWPQKEMEIKDKKEN